MDGHNSEKSLTGHGSSEVGVGRVMDPISGTFHLLIPCSRMSLRLEKKDCDPR